MGRRVRDDEECGQHGSPGKEVEQGRSGASGTAPVVADQRQAAQGSQKANRHPPGDQAQPADDQAAQGEGGIDPFPAGAAEVPEGGIPSEGFRHRQPFPVAQGGERRGTCVPICERRPFGQRSGIGNQHQGIAGHGRVEQIVAQPAERLPGQQDGSQDGHRRHMPRQVRRQRQRQNERGDHERAIQGREAGRQQRLPTQAPAQKFAGIGQGRGDG